MENGQAKPLLLSLDKSCFPECRNHVAFMLNSGIRLGEMLAIKAGQVNLIEKCISLPANKAKSKGVADLNGSYASACSAAKVHCYFLVTGCIFLTGNLLNKYMFFCIMNIE